MISPAIMVKGLPGAFGKPTDYVLYPDSVDPELYYALAEFPTLLSDGKDNPAFNLTWYFGTGVVSGGICTLTVGLPIPPDTEEVKAKIVEAIKGDKTATTIAKKTWEFCDATKKKENDRATALKKELGFNDDTAKIKADAFKPEESYTQFLPVARLKLAAVPFKSGSVVVQAFADEKNYKAGDPAFTTGKLTTTPSLINSNAAVVTFNLQDQGANLFWHGMGGPSFDGPRPKEYNLDLGSKSVISVVYKVEFDGLLPSAQATVTFKAQKIAELATREINAGGWGRRYKEQVTSKDYKETIDDATEITLPTWTSKEDRAAVEKLLTDWAAKQLDEMVASQMPNVKLEDLNTEGARKISVLKQQTRTYKLNQAFTILKNPQAQLPQIKGSEPGKFFHLINLNDKPFFDVDLTVAPPSNEFMKARKISRFVVTDLTFGKKKLLRKTDSKPVGQLEYAVGNSPAASETLSGTFDNNDSNKSVEYSYLVGYTDGTKSFQAKPTSQTGKYQLDLAGVDLGVLAVKLDAVDLPWDVVTSARVDLSYGSWQTTEIIKKDDPPHFVVKPFGEPITKALKYKLTLTLTAGSPVVVPDKEVSLDLGEGTIRLPNPFGTSTYQVNFDMDSDASKAQLKVEYKTAVNGSAARVFSETIRLDSNNPKATWTVPKGSTPNDTFQVVKARVTDTSNASKDLKSEVQTVGENDRGIDVTVAPNEITFF